MRHRLSAAAALAAAAFWSLGSGVAAAAPEPVLPEPAPIAPTDGPPPAPADPYSAVSQLTKSDPKAALAQMMGFGPGGPSAGASAAIGLSAPSPVDPLAGLSQLMPQNYRMPAGDNPYALTTDFEPGPYARVNIWKGQHAMGHAITGRMPGADLGNPLPGTAPLPGTNLPPGLEQYYVPPAAPGDAPPAVPIFPPAPPAN